MGEMGQSQDYGQEQRVTLGKSGASIDRKELWAEVRAPGWQRICVVPKADIGIMALGYNADPSHDYCLYLHLFPAAKHLL